MATIIEFELPADEFALHETLTACPDAVFEVERVVATNPEQITPYVWVQADGFDELERAFEADPTVEATTVLSETDGERSYRMEWTGPIDLIVHILTEQEGTITHAEGDSDSWRLTVLFPERAALSQAHSYAQEHGFSLDVREIYELEGARRAQFDLTSGQHEVLVAGFEAGYFEVPRKMMLSEFAAQEGISHQALSERLRRGTNSLIERTLITGEGDDQYDV
jgi:predicted DNA binding protein